MKELMPSLPCEAKDWSCWKSLAIGAA